MANLYLRKANPQVIHYKHYIYSIGYISMSMGLILLWYCDKTSTKNKNSNKY